MKTAPSPSNQWLYCCPPCENFAGPALYKRPFKSGGIVPSILSDRGSTVSNGRSERAPDQALRDHVEVVGVGVGSGDGSDNDAFPLVDADDSDEEAVMMTEFEEGEEEDLVTLTGTEKQCVKETISASNKNLNSDGMLVLLCEYHRKQHNNNGVNLNGCPQRHEK